MPMSCKVSADAGTPLVISTSAPSVILQGTTSSAKPIRLKRIEMQSNNTGATQQVVTVSLGTYTTATSAGTTVTAGPIDPGSGYSPATTFKANTTTLGTTFAQIKSWQWNTANPFDIVDGLQELQYEFQVSKPWALIFPTTPGSALSVTLTVHFEEFG